MIASVSTWQAAALATMIALAAGSTGALAQAEVTRDGSGQIVAMSGLSPKADCVPATATGTIRDRHRQNGLVRGITFRDMDDNEEIDVNVPELYQFEGAAAKRLIGEAYRALLEQPHRLTIRFKLCGAAGRIKKLDAAALATGVASAQRALSPPASAREQTMDKAENALLRSASATPDSMRSPETPAVAAPRDAQKAAPSPADSEPDENYVGWRIAREDRATKFGFADGNHFAGIYFRCPMRSGMVEIHPEDSKSRERVGSRTTFTLMAGAKSVSIQGKAVVSDFDGERVIEAKAPFEAVLPTLAEMARGAALTFTTRADRTVLPTTGSAKAAGEFLAACSAAR